MLDLESLDDLIPARRAAEICGVTVDTIHKWRKKGYLEVKGLDAKNHSMYKVIDVMRAEQRTRRQMLGKHRVSA